MPFLVPVKGGAERIRLNLMKAFLTNSPDSYVAMYIPPFVMLGTIILGILAWVLWLWLGKMKVSIHRVALLATAIPQALLVIVFVALFLLTAGSAEMRALSDIWVSCFFISFGIATAAFLSSVIFAIGREWEIAKGTSLGGGIGFVVSVIAFFVAFSLYA